MLQIFQRDLDREEGTLEDCLRQGGDILKKAHPDAVPTLKHRLNVLQTRWEDVRVLLHLYDENRGIVNTLKDVCVWDC